MIITEDQIKKAKLQLMEGVIKQQILKELDARGVDRQFANQRNMNFKNHAKTVRELASKGIEPKFIDFSNGIAVFKIKSSYWKSGHGDKPTEYEMAIRFYNWNQFFDDPQMTFAHRIKNLVSGNLGLSCGCNSFRYNYGYQTFIKGSELFDDDHKQFQSTTPAPKTNPQNIGIGCKHLARLMNPYFYRNIVIPDVAKNIFDKLPKKTGVSPSAPNSVRAGADVGVKVK